MKEIPLTQGKVALVDDADFERVSRFKWYAVKSHRNWYVRRRQGEGGQWLHHFVFGEKTKLDHRDNDGLNNQRGNLRPCSNRQNGGNRRPQKHSSRYKGVTWWKNQKKWVATINYETRIHLGYFASEEQAAHAYDAAAKKLFGEFALVNFKETEAHH